MSATASTLATLAKPGLDRLGFVVEKVEDEGRRVVALRSGAYSRQELTLQSSASNRLRATMRVCATAPGVGVVRWQYANLSPFGLPDDGVEYGERQGMKTAVDEVLGILKVFVLPLLDKLPDIGR